MKNVVAETSGRAEMVRVGVMYGLVAGLAFSLAAWGADALSLARAHAYFPWLKLAVGLIPGLAAGTLAGYLTARSESAVVRILVWAAVGAGLALLAGRIAHEITYTALGWLDSNVQRMVNLSTVISVQTNMIFSAVILAGIGVLAGVFQGNFMDSTWGAPAAFSRILPVMIWAAFFIIGGLVVDGRINEPMRSPVVKIGSIIEYRNQTEGKIDPVTAHQMYLDIFNPFSDLLARPYRLILGRYDELIHSVEVYVNFDGQWLDCSVIGNQPTYCQEMK